MNKILSRRGSAEKVETPKISLIKETPKNPVEDLQSRIAANKAEIDKSRSLSVMGIGAGMFILGLIISTPDSKKHDNIGMTLESVCDAAVFGIGAMATLRTVTLAIETAQLSGSLATYELQNAAANSIALPGTEQQVIVPAVPHLEG